MGDIEVPPWLGAALGAVATVASGVLIWLATRLTGKANVQTAMTSQFNALMAETRAQLVDTRAELKEARTQRDEFRNLLDTEKAARLHDRDVFTGEVAQLRAIVDGLERLLRRNNISIPPRRHHAAPAPDFEVVMTTLRQDVPGAEGD